jgi:putative toxin-antitoxin system antitoxin component (TIGR02293 family)
MTETLTGAVSSRARRTSQKLGGKRLLGVDVRSEADLLAVVEHRLPLDALSALVEEGLSPEETARLIIPRRTLSHRKARKQPLSQAESERAVRVASIIALAEDIFADRDKAGAWLRRPTTVFGGKRPIDLLATEIGAQMVEQLLYRIAHGIAA